MKALMLATAAAALATAPAFAQDNVVNVYNWSDYIAADTIAEFEAETGIRVVYDVYDSNETVEAKLLAGNSGYDVVVPTSQYLQRQVMADVYLPFDKSKLPNLANMDPEQMANAAAYDPDNAHSTIYMWGTTGIGYNKAKVAERLGADAEVDTWAMVFDPEITAKLADCGISMLDSSSDMLPAALAYLGKDPTSSDEADLAAAAELIKTVRSNIRYYHSSQYINDLANGETCVAVGFSGDVFIAADRAAEVGRGVEVGYAVPKEGANQWFDLMAIPADAPHPDNAHAFINFMMKPEVMAAVTNHVFYANANVPALEFVDPEIRDDPAIYPPAEVQEKMFPLVVRDARTDRLMTRLWTEVKTGQ